ncbi:MAG: phosphoglucosamine mutase [Cyanobacteria bacterium SBLK]|nr:phosphoglucosamine mutase [Cyanobacteria bacterium SBLK]
MVSSPISIQGSIARNGGPFSISNSQFLPHIPLPNTPLFGTDGIRGKAGELLNASLALRVGFWAGRVLQENATTPGAIAIGQDSRNSSDMLATALTAGLTSAGIEVWQLGLCPTPCVSYSVGHTDAIGGIMISASHNPPEDNGIKFFGSNGTKLSQDLTDRLEAALRGQADFANTSQHWGKSCPRPELIAGYGEFLARSLSSGMDFQGLRIVLDLAWGASVQIAPQVFRALGAEVICLHEDPDGDRINVNCGSTHLDLLQTAVGEYQADLGFAFDGDADRVMAVDNRGRAVDGDYILYLWGRALQQQQQLPNNLIIATVMANLGFERAWQKQGGKFQRTKVGDRYVQAAMLETGAMLGGEQSGHILCHHHSYSGDGLQTALHLTALVQQSGNSLAELVKESFQTYPQVLRNVRVEDRDRRANWKDCHELQQAIEQAETALGDDGRVLIRASGTEPVIRVMVEAACPDSVQHWTEELSRTVQHYSLT